LKKIPSTKPFFRNKEKIFLAINNIIKSGRFILGPYNEEFEEKFSSYVGTKYAVAVSSCTAAMEIALRYFDVRGREVIIPTNTFVASANAVLFAGGKPILTDINPDSLCMDVLDFQKKINAKTRGVIVVHIAGLVHPEIDLIRRICKKNKLFLIEDAAHACGAQFNNIKAGAFGDAGCHSFYPTKIITTGTGGMITTDNVKLCRFALSLRHHGVGQGLNDIQRLGNDWLLDEVRAVLGISQLSNIEEAIHKRRKIAKKYDSVLKDIPYLKLISRFPNIRHVYYKYPVQLESEEKRNLLQKNLKEKYGIETGSIYSPPVHLHSYASKYGLNRGKFPVADDVLRRILCLPVYPDMKENETDFVLDCFLKELLAIARRKK
jgi:dTDP-4-amino-4,6-dideoxygalactose transaminase